LTVDLVTLNVYTSEPAMSYSDLNIENLGVVFTFAFTVSGFQSPVAMFWQSA